LQHATRAQSATADRKALDNALLEARQHRHQPVGETAAPNETALDRRPSPTVLLGTPGGMLTRSHLRDLGLERRAIDAVFRALPVISLPGYSRPLVRVEDYLGLIETNTYRDDRVRPCT